MILAKIDNREKEMIKGGSTIALKRILESELESLKNNLLDCPLDKTEELKAEGKLLREIIKLL